MVSLYQSISVSLKYLSNRQLNFRGYKTSYVALTTVEKRALREQQFVYLIGVLTVLFFIVSCYHNCSKRWLHPFMIQVQEPCIAFENFMTQDES